MTSLGWDPHFLQRSPIFEPLRVHGAALSAAHWPALGELQRLLDARTPAVCTHGGARLSFVPQQRRPAAFDEKYEPRIYLQGEVQVRERNWHDLLNALVWLTFPLSKAALNARHYHALCEQQFAATPNRGPVQDALTLFDEGGVIVVARDRALLGLLEGFAWKELFWHRRAAVAADMRFYVFGHALYEKALCPFAGVTGRAVLIEAEGDLLEAPLPVQLAELDGRLAAYLGDPCRLRATRELAPVPILGVPGWCDENALEAYYDNADYFRSGRGAAARP